MIKEIETPGQCGEFLIFSSRQMTNGRLEWESLGTRSALFDELCRMLFSVNSTTRHPLRLCGAKAQRIYFILCPINKIYYFSSLNFVQFFSLFFFLNIVLDSFFHIHFEGGGVNLSHRQGNFCFCFYLVRRLII